VRTHFLCDFHSKSVVETALEVDAGKLARLGLRVPGKLAPLARDVCLWRLALRTLFPLASINMKHVYHQYEDQ
jgi:hypothetical protein